MTRGAIVGTETVRPWLLAVMAAALTVVTACGDTAGSSTTAAASSAASGPSSSSAASSGPVTVAFQGTDSCRAEGQQPYSPSPPGTTGPPVGEAITEMPHAHVPTGTRVTYLHNPPTSGCHWSSADPPAPMRPGVYTAEPQPEQWVHNLEHGYVVVLYRCADGCPGDLRTLSDWARALPPDVQGGVPYPKLLVVPDSAMPVRFACVSWDWYLGMDTLDLGRVQAFYSSHAGHSPEGATAG